MQPFSRAVLITAIAALAAATAPQPSGAGEERLSQGTPRTGNATPQERVPQAQEPNGSGGSAEPLSKKLDRSGGLIRPPSGVDPGMHQPAPPAGQHSTPVIPPPGTPGGAEGVTPK